MLEKAGSYQKSKEKGFSTASFNPDYFSQEGFDFLKNFSSVGAAGASCYLLFLSSFELSIPLITRENCTHNEEVDNRTQICLCNTIPCKFSDVVSDRSFKAGFNRGEGDDIINK